MSTATKKTVLISVYGTTGNFEQQFTVGDSICVLDGEEIAPGMRIFRVLNQKDGDKRIVWNNLNMKQIQEAKEMFDQFVEQGLVPYRADGDKTGEVMSEFDPGAEEVIFVPEMALAGG